MWVDFDYRKMEAPAADEALPATNATSTSSIAEICSCGFLCSVGVIVRHQVVVQFNQFCLSHSSTLNKTKTLHASANSRDSPVEAVENVLEVLLLSRGSQPSPIRSREKSCFRQNRLDCGANALL